MFPRFPLSNEHDERSANAKCGGNRALSSGIRTDQADLLFCQFRSAMSYAFAFVAAIFGDHIRHIFTMRPGKQMFFGNASMSVAGMANLFAERHRSLFVFVCPNMSAFFDALKRHDAVRRLRAFVGAPPHPATCLRFIFRVEGQSFRQRHLVMNADTTIFGHSPYVPNSLANV